MDNVTPSKVVENKEVHSSIQLKHTTYLPNTEGKGKSH